MNTLAAYAPSWVTQTKQTKTTFDELYGICRRSGYCVEECGLCKFIEPSNINSYKSTNQAYNYRRKQEEGTLYTPDTPGIQVGYKEPLKPVENGFGYFGTLTISEDERCVQCHQCGFFFKLLSQHVKEHNLSGEEYKKRYGLQLKTTLMTDSARTDRNFKRPYNYSKEHISKLHEARVKALEAIKTSDKIGKDGRALEYYNKFGICPDQMIDKYLKLQTKLGHPPSYREMSKEYNHGAPRLLMRVFGRWSEVKRELT